MNHDRQDWRTDVVNRGTYYFPNNYENLIRGSFVVAWENDYEEPIIGESLLL